MSPIRVACRYPHVLANSGLQAQNRRVPNTRHMKIVDSPVRIVPVVRCWRCMKNDGRLPPPMRNSKIEVAMIFDGTALTIYQQALVDN